MRLSIIIPTYILTKAIEGLTLEALASYRDQADEIIVTEDGGFFSPSILDNCDDYFYHHQNRGFVKNVNEAWNYAHGDYIAIVNSDTTLVRGNLNDLCVEGKITCPITQNQTVDLLAGHFFVVPKSFFGKAILDSRFHTFCSDADLERRFYDKIVQIPSVTIHHGINQTLNATGLLTGKQMTEDRKVLEFLWSR